MNFLRTKSQKQDCFKTSSKMDRPWAYRRFYMSPLLSLGELRTQNAMPRCKGKISRKPQNCGFLNSGDHGRKKPFSSATFSSEAC
jgi:hypothetical protein